MSRIPWIPLFAAILLAMPWAIFSQNNDLTSEVAFSHAENTPSPSDESTTNFGNGTIASSFWADSNDLSGIQDTWLGAAQPDSNHGSDTELKAGFSANSSSRWNSLFGIDLSQTNIPHNVTIQSATLALYAKQTSGQPTLRSWICYDETWDASQTDWNDWSVGGALGNQDSGKMMDEVTIATTPGWTEIDITTAIEVAYERYRTGYDSSASILLTGPAWGEDWATFHSSEYVFASERPHFNVTYTWGTTALSGNVEWVDVFPKAPHRIDADNQLTLQAQARTGAGVVASGTTSWTANVGAIDSGGIYTPSQSGIDQIGATISGKTGTLNLQVTPGTPINLDLEAKNVEMTIDESFEFNYTFVDANGNDVTDSTLTWYADYGLINETGFYQPTAVGSDQVTVIWQTLVATADIVVSAGTATNITIESNLSVASGEQVPLLFTVTDRLGNVLPNTAAGSISWVAENGHVDGVGIYTGANVGTWRINATSTSGASGHTFVEVTPGTLASIALVAPNGSQPADEAVLLIVNWLDVLGNEVPVRIPLSNWTAEDGNFRMTPEGVEWLPRREGEWKVGVHVEDEWANATITVVHGAVDHILIASSSEMINADENLALTMDAEDSKGNRWQVNGNWVMMEPEAAPWLSYTANGAQFDGVVSGNWTIRAEYVVGNDSFSTFLVLEVIPGTLAQILLEGDGLQVSADSWHDFSPQFFDEDGNQLGEIQLNWTFSHNGIESDRSGEIRSNSGIWYPVSSGHHEIEVEAAGVFASLGIDVEPGIAHTIRSLQTNGVVVKSGNITTIQINATDLDGNDFGTDVSWTLPHNSVDLTNGTRAGEYLVRGIKAGSYNLEFYSGLADGEVTIIVQNGEVTSLEVKINKQNVKTGEIIDVEIIAYDYGKNKIQINPDDVMISSTVGDFGYSTGDFWQLSVDNSGNQQRIDVNYDSAHGEAYVDVSADPLRAFGDSNLATTLWVGIAAVLMLFTLLIAMLRRRSRVEQDALDHHFGEHENEPSKANVDLMAGYKPSKKARMAARQAFQQMQPAMGHANWAGYQQAQQSAESAVQMAYEKQQVAEPVMAQTAFQQQETAPQPTSQPELETWTNSTSDEQTTGEHWTTEQVWAWGRSQGWSDEQIANYESVYEESVRNPSSQEPTTETIPIEPQVVSEEVVEIQPPPVEEVIETSEVEQTETTPPVEQSVVKDVRQKGIMKAMPGTTQGEAGWYLDGDGNPSRWDIELDGTWHRTG